MSFFCDDEDDSDDRTPPMVNVIGIHTSRFSMPSRFINNSIEERTMRSDNMLPLSLFPDTTLQNQESMNRPTDSQISFLFPSMYPANFPVPNDNTVSNNADTTKTNHDKSKQVDDVAAYNPFSRTLQTEYDILTNRYNLLHDENVKLNELLSQQIRKQNQHDSLVRLENIKMQNNNPMLRKPLSPKHNPGQLVPVQNVLQPSTARTIWNDY
eukprot:3934079-Rhodomonas_salina.1